MIREARRFNVLCCGRRFGKTQLGIDRLIRDPLEGLPAGWFAPSYKYADEVWLQVKRVLRDVTSRSNETKRRLELVTGGLIEVWSLVDEDAGRSRKYATIVIDEAAKVPKLDMVWAETLRATLTDYEGKAWMLSTPRGQGPFHLFWSRGLDPGYPDWASWQLPTSANPFISRAEIEAARRETTERTFAQEYLAQFTGDVGGVFRKVAEAVDAERKANEPPAEGRTYSLGVDLARVEDFTVVTVLDDQRRQVYHERFNQVSWERQTATIETVAKRYKASIVIDSTGVGDPIYEALRKRHLRVRPFHFTNVTKESLIDGLAIDLEFGRLRLMDVPVQTNELQAFRFEMTPSRNVRMSAPEGGHDDTVIALALANWAWTKNARPQAGMPIW